ncbi:hydroxymethylbilane synthase [Thalassoglobus polymorphus]|uniref:Porphobilinogen deaminase n=1 Tax=Thalassoglobus polymorphus TaxID=2527994 RepID=A0A517QU03_9PLAN|nr:hydroxymethylbilane synthase [Thalassoglobus polymorphus]QDT35058.1 Porphobilinogen deaminase [Thalassoglobus polymorphus]
MATEQRIIRIATRESQLAMWQANYIADRLRETTSLFDVALVPVSTIGDRDRTEPLREMGGQGVFTREVQRVVLENHADIAVHSLKDLPTGPIPGLSLAGIPERAPRFDAMILPEDSQVRTFDDLPAGSRIGTGSPRRQSQLLSSRRDLELLEIRGNLDTRLKKLDTGEYDAIILAEAGLRRLGLEQRISFLLTPPLMLPAVGQAALGIECREDDQEVIELLHQISHAQTKIEVTAERACMFTLQAGCHAPVGVLCQQDQEGLKLDAVALSPDGKARFDVSVTGDPASPAELGAEVAKQLIEQGASKYL